MPDRSVTALYPFVLISIPEIIIVRAFGLFIAKRFIHFCFHHFPNSSAEKTFQGIINRCHRHIFIFVLIPPVQALLTKKSLFRDFLMRLTGLRPSDLSSLAFARAFGRKNMPPAYFYSRPHTSGSSPVNKKSPFSGTF